MAISSYLREKRYPFIFAVSLLILAVTLLLVSNSQYSTFFSFSSLPNSITLLREFSVSSYLPSPPRILSPPPVVRSEPPLLRREDFADHSIPVLLSPPIRSEPPQLRRDNVADHPLPTSSSEPPPFGRDNIAHDLPPAIRSEPTQLRRDDIADNTPPVFLPPPIRSEPPQLHRNDIADHLPPVIRSEPELRRDDATIPPIDHPPEEERTTQPTLPPENPKLPIVSPSGLPVTRSEIEFDDYLVNLKWQICEGAIAVDYVPCLDNFRAIKKLRKEKKKRLEHRERHCPVWSPRCLVPLPKGYRLPILWPKSRDMIWYNNVPHPKLVDYKKDQRWVIKSGDHFVFPGGGTQFREGASGYIKFIEQAVPAIKLGQNIRVVLDVGCGVASFGGNLMDKDVLTMSFAPKDEHEAQIQFALERGIPAILSVIATHQLTFPTHVYDLIHCARCRVPWHENGGIRLLELNRLLRPGGLFIWSATPVYQKDERHVKIWNSMTALTESMCWKVVTKTKTPTGVGLVVYQKPFLASCYEEREKNDPPMCKRAARNISWYTPLQKCLSKLPPRESDWPPVWPERLTLTPQSLRARPVDKELFNNDTKYWSTLVSDVYLGALSINWTTVRNVMDMAAGQGGFAAALIQMPLWVMNVVPIYEPDTLPIIFDRGLIGVYNDWCESFNTYPRTYDLLHSNFVFSNLPERCNIIDLAVEIDRIARPGGYILVQDTQKMIRKVGSIFRSLQWSINLYNDRYLVGKKSLWRPQDGEVQR